MDFNCYDYCLASLNGWPNHNMKEKFCPDISPSVEGKRPGIFLKKPYIMIIGFFLVAAFIALIFWAATRDGSVYPVLPAEKSEEKDPHDPE